MDKSGKIMSFGILALVFVVYYFVTGNQDAVGETFKSMILVAVATIITWAVIREQKHRGKNST